MRSVALTSKPTTKTRPSLWNRCRVPLQRALGILLDYSAYNQEDSSDTLEGDFGVYDLGETT